MLPSQAGGLSIIDMWLSDATLTAIAEVNANGHVLGRQIQSIVDDGVCDPKPFNEKAFKLVIQDSDQAYRYAPALRPAVRHPGSGPDLQNVSVPAALTGAVPVFGAGIDA